jgi:ATP-dependent helicase/nuclease subunit B
MPAPSLHFWDWNRPILQHAVDELTRGWTGGELNLSGKLLIVPTAEAGRRLREALAIAAAQRDGAVVAPWVWHPEMALKWEQGNRDAASAVQEQMAWRSVLSSVRAAEFPTLFPSMAASPEAAWISGTAEVLCGLARTLGAGGHTMESVSQALKGVEDHARWLELAELEKRYLAVLATMNLQDAQAIKRAHASQPHLPDDVGEVLVLAVSDPPPLLREWITAASSDISVKIFVHAPRSMRGAFDGLGCPSLDAWGESAGLVLPLSDASLHIVSIPQEQAACAVARLIEMAHAGLTVAVGACDPALNAHLAGALSAEDAVAFDPAGRAADQHALAHVLRAWLRAAQSGTWRDAAAFLRMEDVVQPVCARSSLKEAGLLRLVDELHAEHLPPTLEDAVEFAVDEPFTLLREPLEHMKDLADLWSKSSCTAALRPLLEWLYGDREFATEHELDSDYVKLTGEAMRLAAELDETQIALGVKTSALELLGLLLDQLEQSRLSDTRGDVDFVLHGWLELPWEPAAGLVIAGFNEEQVPGIITSDAFLPDSLRRKLGLASQASRRARDAFLLRAMAEQRREGGALHLILGRVNEQGDAQRPSRLLFDCADAALVARVRHLFPKDEEAPREATPPVSIGFRLRPPGMSESLESISPSSLRAYLACPFHFYLTHVLRIDEVDPTQCEAAPGDFGDLIHETLRQYACDSVMQECVDVAATARWLDDAVVQLWRARFGARPLLSIELQLESARQRLVAAAEHLAVLRTEGWRTIHSEHKVKDWGLSLGGVKFSGKIDRVDRLSGTDEFRVWDYKTGAKKIKPHEAHWAKADDEDTDRSWQRVTDSGGKPRRWVDLQLPLYVWALRQKHPDAKITAGYFILPATVTDTGTLLWEDLEEETVNDGVRCAQEAVKRICAGEFWPPAADPPMDAWEPLLGDPLQTVDPSALMERSAA